MFDNLFTTLINSASNFSDTLKTKSRDFSDNVINIKQNFIRKIRSNKFSSRYIDCDIDYIENMSLPPRAMTVFKDNSNIINENMEWLPYMPTYDEQNLVDRFVRVITIDDDEDRRMDREEIRRRLAMGSDDYYIEKFSRKPSLQERLQSGMNLQICFMNESLSDTDSPSSNSESPEANPKQLKPCFKVSQQEVVRPATLNIVKQGKSEKPATEMDFFTKQAKLQTEARMALAQAKEMARMQMEIERQRQKKSPITELIRRSLEKIGIPFPEGKRRLSRQILTEMNVAQLQVIVNDLHSQIETLNEALVGHLMERDDLHMEQDSMLVDIEDLTRYLDAKEQVLKEQGPVSLQQNNNPVASSPTSPSSLPLSSLNRSVKPHIHKIVNLVKKT